MKNKYFLLLARLLPYLLIVTFVAIIVGSVVVGRYSFAISGLILAVPTIAAAIMLVQICRCDLDPLSGSITLFLFRQKTLALLFGVVFCLTIALGLLYPAKSPYFLTGIVALYTVVLLQIFTRNHRPTFILIEIVLTMACLIYQTTFTYPYYFGWADILPHIYMSTVTYLSGHVIPPDLNIGYAYFPLYHIWIALSSHVLALSIKTTLFVIACPVYVMTTIILYYLFNRVTGSMQISLLASLLYSIDSTVTFYGTYMITRAAAHIGFVLLLYLLIFRANQDGMPKKSMLFRILAILVTLYILMVHQVSTPQMLFLLLLLLSCEWFVKAEKRLQKSFLAFEIILFLAYWFYISFDFSRSTIITRIRPEVFEIPVVMENVQSYSPLTFLFNNVDVLIFLFFAIIGIGYLLWEQKPAYALVFGLFALLTIVLYIPTPLQTFWQTMALFRFDRFMLFISPFMAFAMSWGLYIASRYLQNRISTRATGLIVLLVFGVYCYGTVGVLIEETPNSRYSFTSEELNGFNHIYSHVPYGSTIYSDYYITRYFSQGYFSESEALGIPFYRSSIIRSAVDIPSYRGFIIIPLDQFLEHGLTFSKGDDLNPEGGVYPYLPSDDSISALSVNLTWKNKIFSSRFIDVYHL